MCVWSDCTTLSSPGLTRYCIHILITAFVYKVLPRTVESLLCVLTKYLLSESVISALFCYCSHTMIFRKEWDSCCSSSINSRPFYPCWYRTARKTLDRNDVCVWVYVEAKRSTSSVISLLSTVPLPLFLNKQINKRKDKIFPWLGICQLGWLTDQQAPGFSLSHLPALAL